MDIAPREPFSILDWSARDFIQWAPSSVTLKEYYTHGAFIGGWVTYFRFAKNFPYGTFPDDDKRKSILLQPENFGELICWWSQRACSRPAHPS